MNLDQIFSEYYNSPIRNYSIEIKEGDCEHLKELLSTITDPEIPVINIVELGILRSIQYISNQYLIQITPTYIGCPAMGMIEMNIRSLLDVNNIHNYKIETILSPVWTTDWLSAETKTKLQNFGIAPPMNSYRIQKMFETQGVIPCPQCHSTHTAMISEFGSTACKSLFKCLDCKEPFDYFKCH